MKKEFFKRLRTANVARDKEWSEAEQTAFTPMFFANGILGEVGELANLLKKLERERMGKTGSRAAPAAVGEELADVVIYTDLLAWTLGIEFGTQLPSWPPAERVNYSRLGAGLGKNVGRVCALMLEYEGKYNRQPLTLVREPIYGIITQAKLVADHMGLDFYKAVATKFNMTSEKYGMQTRLAL